MGENLIIIIEVYGYLNNEYPHWENSSISLVEILSPNQFPLCDDEIRVLCESLEEITPLKNERLHKLTLKRIYNKGGYQQPDECYYEKINIELVPHTCLTCGVKMDKKDSDLIDVYGVDPYCSQWCSELGNGTPMPYSQGAHVYDKIWNA